MVICSGAMAWRKPGRVHFRARKRRQGTSSDGGFSGVELEEFFRDALTLQPAACVYDSAIIWKINFL